jgi:hypothetical protein
MNTTRAFAPRLMALVVSFAALSAAEEQRPSAQPAGDDKPVAKEKKDKDAGPLRYQESVEVQGALPAVPAWNLTLMRGLVPMLATPASVSVVSRTLFQGQAALHVVTAPEPPR